MKRIFRISPHVHSGKLLPHEHTSYAGLAFAMLLLGLMMVTISSISLAASSVTVGAFVPYKPPTSPPTITGPANNQVFTSSTATIEGTCGSGLVVKITRNGVLAGSAPCTNGHFKLDITLVLGSNTLRAIQYNAADQPSPVSNTVEVGYTVPTSSSKQQTAAGQLVAPVRLLEISSPAAYQFAEIKKEIAWPFQITGGKAPYAISLDWGDGTIDPISRASDGGFHANHTYKSPGEYKVLVRVGDSANNSAFLQLAAAVSGEPVPASPTTNTGLLDQAGTLLILWPLYILMAIVIISFWLGELHELWRLRRDNPEIRL